MCVSLRRGGHFCSFWSSRLCKVMDPQSRPLANNNAKTWNIRQNRISNNNEGHPKSSHTVGEATSAATTTQQQRNNNAISHRWGNVVAEVLHLLKFIYKNTTKSSHTVGGALTTTQQQNNNNATTNPTTKPINTLGERRVWSASFALI